MFNLFPNDLLYEVFDYLTTYEILYAFNGLNARLNTVLKNYHQYDLRLQSVPKSTFDFICRAIRPEQVRSLLLSDSDDTCRQVHTFFELFYIKQFMNLESITLIDAEERCLAKILPKLNYLPKLSYSSMKLVDGVLPKIPVKSLKCLSLGTCLMSDLLEVLILTPQLQSLSVQLIADPPAVDHAASTIATVTEIHHLKIKLAEKSAITYHHLELLLLRMPKLKKFTFVAERGIRFVHGDQWEHLIRTYIPQLKAFHFKIHPYTTHNNMQQFMSTFQTPFWTTDKKWFFHCNRHHLSGRGTYNLYFMHMYTLPYCDEQFYLSLSTETVTRHASRDDYHSIKNLYFSFDTRRGMALSQHFHFSNLDSLTIGNLHKLISMNDLIDLSHLNHLTLEQNNSINSEEFFSFILSHSTQLQSLQVSWHTLVEITGNFTDIPVCSLLNTTIKHLSLSNILPDEHQHNQKPIEILTQLFSSNLQKLSLNVISLHNIVHLLNEMLRLDCLKIEYNPMHTHIGDIGLHDWLTHHVPTLRNFTYQTRLAAETRVCLVLWIGH